MTAAEELDALIADWRADIDSVPMPAFDVERFVATRGRES